MTSPIRLGIIGTGIFARTAHLASIRNLGDTFTIVALHSRRPESAQAFADLLDSPVDIHTDLDALLARDDLEAVDIVVPIHVMPGLVTTALKAGKHVISEKPIAPSVADGLEMLATYRDQPGDRVWMVAENWRYEESIQQAAMLVRSGAIGRVLAAHWGQIVPFVTSRYFATPWRRSGGFPGGALLDGGVHHVAALRAILGEIGGVRAEVTQHHADLPPADTLSASLTFESGALGSYMITYASQIDAGAPLTIAGETGVLRVQPGEVALTTPGDTHTRTFPPHQSVARELIAFAAAIRQGAPHHNTPASALQDVAVIEAMLESARSGRRVVPARIDP
jgi:predicted dehydrogenase